jgi:hypothetical protein
MASLHRRQEDRREDMSILQLLGLLVLLLLLGLIKDD